MKKIFIVTLLLLLTSGSASAADYSIEFKKDGVILNTQSITPAQIQHLQKDAEGGKSVINQIKEAILDLIAEVTANNKAKWEADNAAYIEEQSRQ